LDKKTFSADDLKDFTSSTVQESDNTKAKMDKAENDRRVALGGTSKEAESKSKNMYEELYDTKIDIKSA
jgi:hypothetical protein